MKLKLLPVLLLTSALTLSGCALFSPPTLGQTTEKIASTLGKPSYITENADGSLRYEYNAGTFGQYTYFATFRNNVMISYEQVWTVATFNSIEPSKATQEDVLAIVGHPTEVRHYANTPDVAWNYGYKESGVWNSQMSIYFNDAGVVTKVENGPDPRFDKEFPFIPF